ncbi:MAG: NAD(P)/FAD-dependent oxidoreductase [Gammaproteobacteria bacterium]|nr:NAD(P)/FAD-dependent oxidoreductase [Gammaproteobacteria bacterium]
MTPPTTCDAVIIGGGHNGLTCAGYLAAAGLNVRVLERRSVVGGAAVTEEFHPGFRNSVASYTVSLLHPKVIADLGLKDFGLTIRERPMANFMPLPDGDHLKLDGAGEDSRRDLARFSERDAQALPHYYRRLERVSDLIRALMLETPPNAGGGLRDLLRLMKVGRRAHRLDLEAQRDLLSLFSRSAGDWLDAWFECEPLKGLLGFDAVVGTFASPYTPGSAYVLLHHLVGEVNGKRGRWGHAVGGMGAITQAMAKSAAARGARISTDAPVRRVLVENGKVSGVELVDGEVVSAPRVVANVNPKLLYLELMDAADLDPAFLRRMREYRCGSASFRMNVALSELPDFRALPGKTPQPHHMSGIFVCPSLGYMDRAYTDAKEHGWSREPVIEMLIPSAVDETLAPKGAHVASLFCQHFSPQLPGGRSWDQEKEAAADLIIDTIDAYAPNFRASVVGRQVLSPQDLEREFGLTGGDIFHGALTLDQLFSARPLLGYGDYRGPVRGLYMCGSGTHPGGGVSGIPGHNAAREILRDR